MCFSFLHQEQKERPSQLP